MKMGLGRLYRILVYLIDIGLDFEIVAATFDEQAEAEILRYHDHGNKTGQWLPISFPQTTSNKAVVTVKKVR